MLPIRHICFILFSIILSGLLFRLQGQTTIPSSRLIATCSESNWVNDTWQKYDSTSYTYSTFNKDLLFPLPQFYGNGLTGHIPTFHPEFPTYNNPLFSTPVSKVFQFIPELAFQQALHFTNTDENDSTNWSPASKEARLFNGDHINRQIEIADLSDTSTYNFYDFVWSGDKIVYGQQGITNASIQDTTIAYTYEYSNTGLSKIITYEFPEWIEGTSKVKTNEVTYTYNDMGLPEEEILRTYQPTIENEGGLSQKWVYNYNDQGLVTEAASFLINDTEWLKHWSLNFTYNASQLADCVVLERTIDTSGVTPYIGEWDTVYTCTYYWLENLLDSVSCFQDNSSGEDLTFYFSEKYTYAEGHLTSYKLNYADLIAKSDEQKDFVYDSNGRPIECLTYYSENYGDDFIWGVDSIFHYDTFGNVALLELAEGGSNIGIEDISFTISSRIHYYYVDQLIAGEGSSDLYLQVYPSPATDNLTITIGTQSGATLFIALNIFTSDGKLVQYESFPVTENATIQIDCSTWAKGVYYVSVKNGSSVAYQKIVKM